MKIFEILAYHGRKSGVKGFDISHTGQNSTAFSDYSSTRWGSFFTTNPEFANIYGSVDQYDLQISKTARLSSALLSSFYDYVESLYKNEQLEKNTFLDIQEIIGGDWDIWQLFEEKTGELFVKWLISKGYDSARYQEFLENDDGEEIGSDTIVVFNPSLIEYKGQIEMDLYKDRLERKNSQS